MEHIIHDSKCTNMERGPGYTAKWEKQVAEQYVYWEPTFI